MNDDRGGIKTVKEFFERIESGELNPVIYVGYKSEKGMGYALDLTDDEAREKLIKLARIGAAALSCTCKKLPPEITHEYCDNPLCSKATICKLRKELQL